MNSIRRLAPTATSNFPDRGGESPWRSVFWLLGVATFVTADTVDNLAARPAALSLFEAVYGRVDSVAGWSRGEALRLVGTLFILVELERSFFRGLHTCPGRWRRGTWSYSSSGRCRHPGGSLPSVSRLSSPWPSTGRWSSASFA